MQSRSIDLLGRFGLTAFCLLSMATIGVAQLVVADSNPDQTIRATVSSKDHLAADGVSLTFRQIMPLKSGLGGAAAGMQAAANPVQKRFGKNQNTSAAPAVLNSWDDNEVPAVPKPGFYPTDLQDLGQGPVVTEAVNYPIYVNTTPAEVGRPGTLLRDLGHSQMVHVIDQYVGATADNRYRVGMGTTVTYPVSGALQEETDIVAIVHAVALSLGQAGYGAIYHVFLARGQDVCSQGTCYSPDHPKLFTYCADHGNIVYSDIGDVLYTVIPFQAVKGCEEGSPSPNGLVIDSTMSTLSHEYFETITDPDGTAWWNQLSLDDYGYEIGDECVTVLPADPIVALNGTRYELQAEYSNKYHACAYVP